jgi:hypothetical protein
LGGTNVADDVDRLLHLVRAGLFMVRLLVEKPNLRPRRNALHETTQTLAVGQERPAVAGTIFYATFAMQQSSLGRIPACDRLSPPSIRMPAAGTPCLVQDASGAIFVTDTGNHTIRRIAPDGTVTTFAGKAGEGGTTDGPRAEARLATPRGIAITAQPRRVG